MRTRASVGRRRAAGAVVLAFLVAWLPAAGATSLPVVVHRGDITVRAERGLEDQAEDLADEAAAGLADAAQDLPGLTAPGEITINLVVDGQDLGAVAPQGRGAPGWAAGVAYPDLGVISIAMRRGPVVFDAAQTLRHELAHIALGAALGPDVPHWLQEGFAYQHTADWSMERAQTLAGMAWFGGVIPLEDLDRAFPAAELPANRAYAESYDFVGYLSIRGRWEDHEDDGDRWAFRTFLGQIAQGGGTDAAIERAAIKAYGRPLHDLFGEWRADLSRRYLLVPLEIFVAFIWIFSALLLTLAYWRKRRLNRVRLAQWDAQDRAAILLQQRPLLTPEDVLGVTGFVVPPGHAAEDLDAQRGVTNTKSRGGTNL